ncbi:MAG: hypothetical protein R2860_10345 [Desulfobacterales bacterium]
MCWKTNGELTHLPPDTPDTTVFGGLDGCLRRLTRDGLPGVVAHEFSHILNSDMRLNIRLIAMISGTSWSATSISQLALRPRRSDPEK